MKRTLVFLVLGLMAISAAVLVTGCNDAEAALGGPSPLVGKGCVVQFRRDALGAASNLPIPPTTSNINGADTSVGGKLKHVTEDWIVINHPEKGELWIARSAVLLLSMGVPAEKPRDK